MDAATISAIGSLWKLGAVVLLVIVVIVFRSQIAGFLEKLKNFTIKKGDAELSITQNPETVDRASWSLGQDVMPGKRYLPPAQITKRQTLS